jgi:hypothetical protein
LYYDVRNKIVEIISEITDVVLNPPCLTFGGMLYTKKVSELNDSMKFNCLVKQSDETIYNIFYDFYLDNFIEFEYFYNASKIANKINETTVKVKAIESDLLFGLKRFVTSWKHPLERGQIASKLKINCARLLEELSEYSVSSGELKVAMRVVKDYRAQNEEFDNFIKEVNIESSIEPDSIDVDSAMNIIEHSREENGAYSSSNTTILSAVGGAVIGSVLTIAFSYLIGLF